MTSLRSRTVAMEIERARLSGPRCDWVRVRLLSPLSVVFTIQNSISSEILCGV